MRKKRSFPKAWRIGQIDPERTFSLRRTEHDRDAVRSSICWAISYNASPW